MLMRLLSSEEAQDKLGISRPTLYLWVKQGKLKPRRAGRGLRFEEDEVMRLLGRGPHVAVWVDAFDQGVGEADLLVHGSLHSPMISSARRSVPASRR